MGRRRCCGTLTHYQAHSAHSLDGLTRPVHHVYNPGDREFHHLYISGESKTSYWLYPLVPGQRKEPILKVPDLLIPRINVL